MKMRSAASALIDTLLLFFYAATHDFQVSRHLFKDEAAITQTRKRITQAAFLQRLVEHLELLVTIGELLRT